MSQCRVIRKQAVYVAVSGAASRPADDAPHNYLDGELAKADYQQAIDDARRGRKPLPSGHVRVGSRRIPRDRLIVWCPSGGRSR